MFDKIEDTRNEFKEIVNDKLEKEVIGFLNNKRKCMVPQGVSKDEFLKGYSFPRHPELMRVFKDLDLVEQLGTGIIIILKVYDKDVYEFSQNFIRVNFKFNNYDVLETRKSQLNNKLTKIQNQIISLIEENNRITQKELMDNLKVSRATITRTISYLKEMGIIERIGSDKTGYWTIIK